VFIVFFYVGLLVNQSQVSVLLVSTVPLISVWSVVTAWSQLASCT